MKPRPYRIDGAIGEGSRFLEEFGCYAQGVDERTATLPIGWRDRLIRIQTDATGGRAGLCLEIHDLAISKYVAGRVIHARAMLVDKPTLVMRGLRMSLR